MRARAALLLLALAAAFRPPSARAALPEGALPADHPCGLGDALFAPLASERGVDVSLALLDGGAVVLRARASLDAPTRSVVAVLEDVARWPAWIGRLRALERLRGDLPAFYAVFRAPWPLEDRDYAFAPFVAHRPDETVVFWEDASDRLPAPATGRARVFPVRGCFAVKPAEAPRTSALVYTELDSFAAGLPAWMRRSGRRRGPVRLVDGLRAALREN